jgi:hypothetical protein
MLDLRLFVQRRRKLLLRVGAVVAVVAGGLLCLAPSIRADAEQVRAPKSDAMALLFSPERVASDRFMASYALEYGPSGAGPEMPTMNGS